MTTDGPNEPNVRQAAPFFAVSNIESSLFYYMNGLGFKIKYKWIDEGKLRWCWLDLGLASLMLEEIPGVCLVRVGGLPLREVAGDLQSHGTRTRKM